jgi:hypothetical protein
VLIIPALRPSVAALLSCRVTFPRWPFPLHRLIRPAVKVASSSSNLITDQRSLPFFNYSDEHLPGRSPGYAGDIVRIENDRLAEHCDVLQGEATKAESKSGLPMFGDRFTA